MRMRKITSAMAAVAMLGALAGCSGDDDGGTPAPTATVGSPTATVVANTSTPTRTSTVPPQVPTATSTLTRTATVPPVDTFTPTPTSEVVATPTDTEAPTQVPTPTNTPELSEPTPTETTATGGLGVRELSVVRVPVVELTDPNSSFNTSAIGGFDVSQDPWLPATFSLQAGEPDGNGVAPLTLLEDVVIGFPVLDSSIACFKFLAEGSSGEVACQAGFGKFVKLSQDSNGNGPPGPLEVTITTDPESVAGSIFLSFTVGFANLPVGNEPSDCVNATFMSGPGAFSSWKGEAEVTDSRPIGETLTLAANGLAFSCDDWTNPTGGMIINPVIGFDQEGLGGGDVANLLVVYGGPAMP